MTSKKTLQKKQKGTAKIAPKTSKEGQKQIKQSLDTLMNGLIIAQHSISQLKKKS